MTEAARRKRDEERERAFLARTRFPSWKSPLGANRAIQAELGEPPITDLFIGSIVLFPPPPAPNVPSVDLM